MKKEEEDSSRRGTLGNATPSRTAPTVADVLVFLEERSKEYRLLAKRRRRQADRHRQPHFRRMSGWGGPSKLNHVLDADECARLADDYEVRAVACEEMAALYKAAFALAARGAVLAPFHQPPVSASVTEDQRGS